MPQRTTPRFGIVCFATTSMLSRHRVFFNHNTWPSLVRSRKSGHTHNGRATITMIFFRQARTTADSLYLNRTRAALPTLRYLGPSPYLHGRRSFSYMAMSLAVHCPFPLPPTMPPSTLTSCYCLTAPILPFLQQCFHLLNVRICVG